MTKPRPSLLPIPCHLTLSCAALLGALLLLAPSSHGVQSQTVPSFSSYDPTERKTLIHGYIRAHAPRYVPLSICQMIVRFTQHFPPLKKPYTLWKNTEDSSMCPLKILPLRGTWVAIVWGAYVDNVIQEEDTTYQGFSYHDLGNPPAKISQNDIVMYKGEKHRYDQKEDRALQESMHAICYVDKVYGKFHGLLVITSSLLSEHDCMVGIMSVYGVTYKGKEQVIVEAEAIQHWVDCSASCDLRSLISLDSSLGWLYGDLDPYEDNIFWGYHDFEKKSTLVFDTACIPPPDRIKSPTVCRCIDKDRFALIWGTEGSEHIAIYRMNQSKTYAHYTIPTKTFFPKSLSPCMFGHISVLACSEKHVVFFKPSSRKSKVYRYDMTKQKVISTLGFDTKCTIIDDTIPRPDTDTYGITMMGKTSTNKQSISLNLFTLEDGAYLYNTTLKTEAEDLGRTKDIVYTGACLLLLFRQGLQIWRLAHG